MEPTIPAPPASAPATQGLSRRRPSRCLQRSRRCALSAHVGALFHGEFKESGFDEDLRAAIVQPLDDALKDPQVVSARDDHQRVRGFIGADLDLSGEQPFRRGAFARLLLGLAFPLPPFGFAGCFGQRIQLERVDANSLASAFSRRRTWMAPSSSGVGRSSLIGAALPALLDHLLGDDDQGVVVGVGDNLLQDDITRLDHGLAAVFLGHFLPRTVKTSPSLGCGSYRLRTAPRSNGSGASRPCRGV